MMFKTTDMFIEGRVVFCFGYFRYFSFWKRTSNLNVYESPSEPRTNVVKNSHQEGIGFDV